MSDALNRTVPIGFAAASLLTFALPAQPAGAADHGNWDRVACADRSEVCMWRTSVGTNPFLSSSERDSEFNNDYYYNGGETTINDEITWVDNHMPVKGVINPSRAPFSPTVLLK